MHQCLSCSSFFNTKLVKGETYLLWFSLGIEGKISLAYSRLSRITRVLYSIKLRSNMYLITLQRRPQMTKKLIMKIIAVAAPIVPSNSSLTIKRGKVDLYQVKI